MEKSCSFVDTDEDGEDGNGSPNVFDMDDVNGDPQTASTTTTNEPAMRGFILKSSAPVDAVDAVDTTPTTAQDETTASSSEPRQTAAAEVPRAAPVIPPKPKIDLAVLMGLSESKYDLPPPPPPKPAKTAAPPATHPSMSDSSVTEPGRLPGPPMSLAASQRRAFLPPPPLSSSSSSLSSSGLRDYSNRSVEDLRRSRVEEETNYGGESEDEERRFNAPPSRHAPSITPQKPRRQAPSLPVPPPSLRLSTRSSFSSDSGNNSNTTTTTNNNNNNNNNNSAMVGPVEPPRPRRQAPALVLQSDPYGAPPSRVVGPPPKPSKPALPEKPRKPSFIQMPSSGGDVGCDESESQYNHE